VIHLANLFPEKKATMTALIVGCFQLSFCIFYVFDQIWFFGGVNYRAIFIVYSVVCFLALCSSVVMWPDEVPAHHTYAVVP
jgi:hypothetical protein